MFRKSLILATLVIFIGCKGRTVGSSIYIPVVPPGIDLTTLGQVQGITGDGGTQLPVVPSNILWSVVSDTPTLSQTYQTAADAGNNILIHAQDSDAGKGGNVVLEPGNTLTASPGAYVQIANASGTLWQLGTLAGQEQNANYQALYPGGVAPNGSNYLMYADTAGAGGPGFNGATVIYLNIGGTGVVTVTSTGVAIVQPVNGASGKPFSEGISNVGLYDAAGGTETLTAAQQGTPVIKLGSVSLTGNATLALGALATCMFDVDATAVTLNAHTLTVSNGAGTSVISGTLGTSTTGPFTRCYCPSNATVVCGG